MLFKKASSPNQLQSVATPDCSKAQNPFMVEACGELVEPIAEPCDSGQAVTFTDPLNIVVVAFSISRLMEIDISGSGSGSGIMTGRAIGLIVIPELSRNPAFIPITETESAELGTISYWPLPFASKIESPIFTLLEAEGDQTALNDESKPNSKTETVVVAPTVGVVLETEILSGILVIVSNKFSSPESKCLLSAVWPNSRFENQVQ